MIRPESPREPEPREEARAATRSGGRDPAPRHIPRFLALAETPATSGLVLLAIFATLLGWTRPLLDQLAMQSDLLHDAPWRPLTATLLHVSPMHLAFNAYWLLALGTPIEKDVGTARTLLGYAVIGLASSAAEQALFSGGVGLSGIGYGVFAYGWVRARRDPAWRVVVDGATARAFGLWFFFCIATTVTGFFPVANVAHGVGALVGGLLAAARTDAWAKVALPLTLALALVLDVQPVRDRVNLAGAPALEAEREGLAAIDAGTPADAIAPLERAAALDPHEPRVLYNLGVARARADAGGACDAYRAALAIDPDYPRAREAANACEAP